MWSSQATAPRHLPTGCKLIVLRRSELLRLAPPSQPPGRSHPYIFPFCLTSAVPHLVHHSLCGIVEHPSKIKLQENSAMGQQCKGCSSSPGQVQLLAPRELHSCIGNVSYGTVCQKLGAMGNQIAASAPQRLSSADLVQAILVWAFLDEQGGILQI